MDRLWRGYGTPDANSPIVPDYCPHRRVDPLFVRDLLSSTLSILRWRRWPYRFHESRNGQPMTRGIETPSRQLSYVQIKDK